MPELSITATPQEIRIPAGVRYIGTVRDADLTFQEWSNGSWKTMVGTPVTAPESFTFYNGGEGGFIRALTSSGTAILNYHREILDTE